MYFVFCSKYVYISIFIQNYNYKLYMAYNMIFFQLTV